MRRVSLAALACLALVVAVLPASASAAPANMIVSFETGEPARLYSLVHNLALGLFVFSLLVALFLEFLNPPDEGPQFAKVAVRAVAILVALILYPTLAGTVVRSLNGLAAKVGPSDIALLAYFEKTVRMQERAIANPNGVTAAPAAAGATGGGGTQQFGTADTKLPAGAPPRPQGTCPQGFSYELVPAGTVLEWKCMPEYVAPKADGWDGMLAGLRRVLMEMVLTWVLAFLGAMKYVVEQLGAILTAVFYILGPLALVAGIPKGSGTAGNWFKHFVTYASWGVFTGLVMQLVIAVSLNATATDSGYIDALWAAIAVAVSFMSVPTLAGQIIGAAGSGFVSGATGAAMGAASAVGGSYAKGATSAGRGTAASAAQTAAGVATGVGVAQALMAHPEIGAAIRSISGGAGGASGASGGAAPANKPAPGGEKEAPGAKTDAASAKGGNAAGERAGAAPANAPEGRGPRGRTAEDGAGEGAAAAPSNAPDGGGAGGRTTEGGAGRRSAEGDPATPTERDSTPREAAAGAAPSNKPGGAAPSADEAAARFNQRRKGNAA